MNKLFLLSIIGLLGACQGNSRLQEKAQIEGRASSEAQVDIENGNLAKKAALMEEDLKKRQRFYDGVAGTYDGIMADSQKQKMNLRLSIVSTVPLVPINRTRTLAEIESDLNNLYLTVYALQWNSQDKVSAGCTFEKVKPDIINGRIELLASACPFLYSLSISVNEKRDAAASVQTSGKVLSGELTGVEYVVGTRQSSSNATVHSFSLRRTALDAVKPGETPYSTTEQEGSRLREMEADLAQRQAFYQSVKGTYEGTLQNDLGKFEVRIVLTPSLPIYAVNRARTPEEISSDLSNLFLNAQVFQWNAPLGVSSGCTFDRIKPDIVLRKINLVSTSCNFSYTLDFAAQKPGTEVLLLFGKRQSVTRATVQGFQVKKVPAAVSLREVPASVVDEDSAYKLREVEKDLGQRRKFYSALQGTYEGDLQMGKSQFRIKFNFVPSLPVYDARRNRTLEEVTNDLNNLHLNIQVVLWNPANELSAVGCRIQGIKPDLQKGLIQIASEACPNFYSIFVESSDPSVDRKALLLKVEKGELSEFQLIKGEVHPTTNAASYKFQAQRKQEETK
ncbi:MAG: hypothetical protein K2X47_04025 [Bdellovibrionales bacterium]|nr:hypothetical protein [Bdellovibrionales bacterium]